MFSPCVATSWPFSLKSKFFLTFLTLEEEGGCPSVVQDISLLFLFPLLGVLDFFEGDFSFSSGYRLVSKPFQKNKCVHAIFLLFRNSWIRICIRPW